MNTVTVSRCARSSRSWRSPAAATGSRPAVGSSRKITRGRWSRARASATFCFMPRLHVPTSSSRRSASPKCVEQLDDAVLEHRRAGGATAVRSTRGSPRPTAARRARCAPAARRTHAAPTRPSRSGIVPEHPGRPCARLDETQQQTDRRGLPGPVGSEEAEHRAGRHLQTRASSTAVTVSKCRVSPTARMADVGATVDGSGELGLDTDRQYRPRVSGFSGCARAARRVVWLLLGRSCAAGRAGPGIARGSGLTPSQYGWARVLVVDDDVGHVPAARADARDDRRHGAVGGPASRAIESVVAEFDPHVILLDVHLGDRSTASRSWRRCGEAGALRDRSVLIATGDTAPTVERRARELGARGVLSKPFDRTELTANIETLLAAGADDAVRHRATTTSTSTSSTAWKREPVRRAGGTHRGPPVTQRSRAERAVPPVPGAAGGQRAAARRQRRQERVPLAREPRGPHPAELHPRVRRAPRPRRPERRAAAVGRHDPRRGPSAACAPRRRARHLTHRERFAVALARRRRRSTT